MTNDTKPDGTIQKKGGRIAWIITIAIILYGAVVWSYSSIASTLLILGGLLLLPPVKIGLISQFKGVLSKPLLLNVFAFALIAIGFSLSSTSIINSNLTEWNGNKTSISQSINNSIESKRFDEANTILRKFSGSVVGDPIFDDLKSKYEEAKNRHEAQIKAEVEDRFAAQREAELKANAIAKAKADAEASSRRASEQAVSNAARSDGRECRVNNILHSTTFSCSGSGNLCGMDAKTVVVINGSILPPHANNTSMIKVGYQCSCLRNSGRINSDKIDCVG
jgi:hypothetical protein